MSKHNIRKMYKYAIANLTEQEQHNAKHWYDEAQQEARQIAERLDMPVYIVVGVMAALSPNNKWERNLVNAYELCKAFQDGQGMDSVKVSTYHKMKEKAWGILTEFPDYETVIVRLSGKKIISFFRNIMGEDDITIDGHARNIYYNERVGLTDAKTSIGVKEYAKLQKEYLTVAKEFDMLGRQMQAITWVAWKKKHNI
jgi:hypothetical protein